jgi:SpoVK/Ycf46/Vps4 family AAA+-type ATPase
MLLDTENSSDFQRLLSEEGIDSSFIEANDYPYTIDPNILKDILARLLCQEMKSVLLVGPTGSGKTALVRYLANFVRQIGHPRVNQFTILSLNVASILAGSEYRGSFEKKVIHILNQCQKYSNLIVFFDEAHSMRFTSFREGVGLMDILKPRMAASNLRMILATTDIEEDHLTRDTAFLRRLHTVTLKPLGAEQSMCVAKMHFERLRRNYCSDASTATVFHHIEFERIYRPDMPLHEQIDLMDFVLSRRMLDEFLG